METVVVTANKFKPFTHAFGLLRGGSHPKAVVSGFFLVLSRPLGVHAARRWWILKNPATRASQSRERGRIPRARWLKQSGIVRGETWLRTAQANFGLDHG